MYSILVFFQECYLLLLGLFKFAMLLVELECCLIGLLMVLTRVIFAYSLKISYLLKFHL